MSERERWIVYPLLFLALGASLRDKIIKTTESQRIKCQGLCVYGDDDQPLLVLGAEQFPELRPGTPNFLNVQRLRVDKLNAQSVNSKLATSNLIVAQSVRTMGAAESSQGNLSADVVVAKNYVLTDGKHYLSIEGKYTVPFIRIINALTAQYQALEQRQIPKAIEDLNRRARQAKSEAEMEDEGGGRETAASSTTEESSSEEAAGELSPEATSNSGDPGVE